MKIFPAIDLMRGKVVRLLRGDPKIVKAYNQLGDPVTIAKKWESEGASGLHIVDLDATFNMGNNLFTISRIIKAVKIPVQVGGGIRSEGAAEKLLNLGADNIILGTLAFTKPKAITYLRERFGDRIIVALDHIDGQVMIEGWRKATKLDVANSLEKFSQLGVKTFLVTSVSRDGTLEGVDIDVLKRACAHQGSRIIAAGGLSSLRDLVLLKQVGAYGVVVGKALYEGAFTLKDILETINEVERCR